MNPYNPRGSHVYGSWFICFNLNLYKVVQSNDTFLKVFRCRWEANPTQTFSLTSVGMMYVLVWTFKLEELFIKDEDKQKVVREHRSKVIFIERLSSRNVFSSLVKQNGQFESEFDSRWRIGLVVVLSINVMKIVVCFTI